MSRSIARISLAVVLAVAIVAAGALGSTYLGLAAPLSGSLYDTAQRGPVVGAEQVENPYGNASVWYDDGGVPHIQASNERALAYATGYVQARDRLFEMDLQRRLISGHLSEAFGNRTLASDRFHRQLDFEGAAEASWANLKGTEAGPSLRAYSAGVNRYIDTRPLPPEFDLLGYEPKRWTPVDTLLIGKQISWSLSGNFADLQRATVRRRLGSDATALYPDALPTNTTIIRGGYATKPFDPTAVALGNASSKRANASNATNASTANATDLSTLYDWVQAYQTKPGIGSNDWVVSGNLTKSGKPLLANDPHLSLTVPSVWYEMHLKAPGIDTRGASFPGIPFVVIGRTKTVAWGVTNVGGDFTDEYTYRTRGGQYWYDGEWCDFRTHDETIRVADGDGYRNVSITVRKTVQGPVIHREGQQVAVAWPGFSATNESLGVYRLDRARTIGDVRAALRDWDVPAQNFVVATAAGKTLYYPAGRYPLRVTDGQVVRGDQVFNGSAGEGQWRSYRPYNTSNWSGFVPFASIPHLDNPAYVTTANQRTVDDPPFYMGNGMTYADSYRAERIYQLLDRRAKSGKPVDAAYMKRIQRDVHSTAADQFVPIALDARSRMSPEAKQAATELDGWNRRMRTDSHAALVYAIWRSTFRNDTFSDEFGARNLSADYYPKDVVLASLPADSSWFDNQSTAKRETRADIAAQAMNETVDEIERAGYQTYGDYNRLHLTHPFDQAFLNYPTRPMNGSAYTVFNFRAHRSTQVGSSWRMVVDFGGQSSGVIPGGQSGIFWSKHYHDQLGTWAEGRYKPMTLDRPTGNPDIVFSKGGRS